MAYAQWKNENLKKAFVLEVILYPLTLVLGLIWMVIQILLVPFALVWYWWNFQR